MNPAKTKFKIDMAEEFGRKFEGMEEEAERSFYRQEGARDALKAAAPQISALMAHIDEEAKEGVLAEFGEPLKVAAYAKKWLQRAIGSIDGMATKAEVARIAAGGTQDGLKRAKEYAHNVWKEEQTKLRAYLEALEEKFPEDEEAKSPDGHPGPTLKSKRKAEEDVPKEAEVPKEPEAEPEPEKVEKTEKKKRLRQPKKKR